MARANSNRNLLANMLILTVILVGLVN